MAERSYRAAWHDVCYVFGQERGKGASMPQGESRWKTSYGTSSGSTRGRSPIT
jgi:hypothetical protein